MADRRIRYVKLDDLKGNPANPKGHDLGLIGASIDRFGLVEPQTMDERTGLLVAGHGRLEELRAKQDAGDEPPEGIRVRAGRWLVPVVYGWSSADDDEALAYLVGSNESTIAGGWDYPKLIPVLEQVAATNLELVGTGFDRGRLDDLLEQIEAGRRDLEAPAPPEDPDPEREIPKRVARGDIWQLGPHRLLCGDSRDAADVGRVLAGAAVNLAFTSPPYADRRKYDETSGFVPIHPDAYVDWFEPVAANVRDHLARDGSWFVNIKPGVTPDNLDTELYVVDLVVAHARSWGWHFATEFCWERNGMPGHATQRFKNQFEPVYQFTRNRWKVRPHAVAIPGTVIHPLGPGTGASTWAEAQGTAVEGRTRFSAERRGDGLAYPGNRLPTFAGTHEATGHTAAFPVGLPAWFIRAFTDPGDVVYDPFMGSGSTLLAADENARIGYGIELSPAYCDLILDRWERHDGEPPVKVDA